MTTYHPPLSNQSSMNRIQHQSSHINAPITLTPDLGLAQLCQSLQASAQKSSELDYELTRLVSERAQIERVLAKSSPHLLESVESIYRSEMSVGGRIRSSDASAQSLSLKVRELDEIAANVSSALTRVESVLALRHTVTIVREKITHGEYASAGDDLYQALFMSRPIVNDLSFQLLIELEKRIRDELQQACLERLIRQGRMENGALFSREVMAFARIWPKIGFGYRGLVMYTAQIRLEVLAAIHKSGYTLQNQHENALIDYVRNVSSIIEVVNTCILQHFRSIGSLFGTGTQIRLIQELLTNVIDVEVAQKLLSRFIDEKKIKDPKGGTLNPNIDDIISRIKQINQRVMSGSSNNTSGGKEVAPYYHPRDPTTQLGSVLYIQSLDELLDEIKILSSKIEEFLTSLDKLIRKNLADMNEQVQSEKERREQHANKGHDLDMKQEDDAWTRFYSSPILSHLPSIHSQPNRVSTIMHQLLQVDKNRTNLLEIPLVEERTTFGTKPTLPTEGPIPPPLFNLPPNSTYVIAGFGLDSNLATSSRLYDVQLTLIGKYVLIEEYYMNFNVEKAIAIDEHDGHSAEMDKTAVSTNRPNQDDLEAELDATERKQATGTAGGLQSLGLAISNTNSGIDPYLYLTGIGASPTGTGIPKSFLLKFASHKTSTLSDNVCFIYKKCLTRSLQTSNRDAIYSILLRIHENFHRKLRKIFEGSIVNYESRFGSKRKSSLTYAIFQRPGDYLFPQAGGNKNLIGAWVSAAATGSGPNAQDLQLKVTGDTSLILTVNNLDSIIENMQSLLKGLDMELEQLYGQESDQDPTRSSTTPAHAHTHGLSLDQFKEKMNEFHSTFQHFDALIGRGLQCMADNLWLRLLPRISLLQTHAGELYGAPELTSIATDLSDSIISGFIEIFKRDILALSHVLTENNQYQLIFKVIKLTVRYLENLVLPKSTSTASSQNDPNSPPTIQFSQIGGVQFDKQVRTLTSFFTNEVAPQLERYFADNFFLYLQPQAPTHTATSSAAAALNDSSSVDLKQWRVSFSGSAQSRQAFSKLAHIGSILSVDKPSEVLEYTERELFHLKKDEVRRILSLRKEFSEREINQLKL